MQKFDFYVIDDIIKPNTKVICRIDINSPLGKDGTILSKWRFQAHKDTLKWLLNNNNAIILLAHQGRPGEPDFTDLKKHAEVLSEIIDTEVKFVNDVTGSKALSAIRNLKPGDILLLDNVRKVPDEMSKKDPHEHSNSTIVKSLSPYADFFVLDGFSVAHRPHASVIGFATVLPSAAGFLFEKEVNHLSKHLEHDSYNFIFGGAKVSDVIKSIKLFLKRGKKIHVFLVGLTALIFHYALGGKVTKQTEEIILKKAKDLLPQIKELSKQVDIVLPLDYALDKNGERMEVDKEELGNYYYTIKDVGTKTVRYYLELLKDSNTVFIKGPAGVIEEEPFKKGSIELLRGLAQQGKYLVFFGGHLASIFEHLEDAKPQQYYVSTGGGSAIHFLANGTLPGIEALELSKKKFIQ